MRIDMPLAITDNVAQRAFVHGESIAFAPDMDFGAIQAKVIVNGEVRESVLGGDVMDNQLQTVAWLANALHRHGRQLQAGQRIMSGSFTKPLPVNADDTIETRFSGVGAVTASFG
jgi:2-oxo-hept-3-ene-1,7-dioate hydratase